MASPRARTDGAVWESETLSQVISDAAWGVIVVTDARAVRKARGFSTPPSAEVILDQPLQLAA